MSDARLKSVSTEEHDAFMRRAFAASPQFQGLESLTWESENSFVLRDRHGHAFLVGGRGYHDALRRMYG